MQMLDKFAQILKTLLELVQFVNEEIFPFLIVILALLIALIAITALMIFIWRGY